MYGNLALNLVLKNSGSLVNLYSENLEPRLQLSKKVDLDKASILG